VFDVATAYRLDYCAARGVPSQHDRGGVGEGWCVIAKIKYPGTRAAVLKALANGKRLSLDELEEILKVPRRYIYYTISTLSSRGLVRGERVSHRVVVYFLVAASGEARREMLNARYVPPFVPLRFDAARCPFARADLCLLTRRG